MDGCARGKALGNYQAVGRLAADGEVAALRAALESLLAIGRDGLQAVQPARCVAQWDQQRAVLPGAMGLNAFAHQVGMPRRRTSRVPAHCGLAGFLLAPCGLGFFALCLHGLDALAMCVPLCRRHGVVGLGAPGRLQASAPAAERAGRDAVAVQDIPAGLALAKAVQHAIVVNHVRRIKTRRINGLAEFVNGVSHGGHCAPPT